MPLRNPPFFGNLSHLLPNKVAQRFSHKSVRVNICLPAPLVKKAARGNSLRESLVLEAGGEGGGHLECSQWKIVIRQLVFVVLI